VSIRLLYSQRLHLFDLKKNSKIVKFDYSLKQHFYFNIFKNVCSCDYFHFYKSKVNMNMLSVQFHDKCQSTLAFPPDFIMVPLYHQSNI